MTNKKISLMIISILILIFIAVTASQLNSVLKTQNRVRENVISKWQERSVDNKILYLEYKLECYKEIDETLDFKEQIESDRKTQKSCNNKKDYKVIYDVYKNIDYSKINIPFPLSIFISEL